MPYAVASLSDTLSGVVRGQLDVRLKLLEERNLAFWRRRKLCTVRLLGASGRNQNTTSFGTCTLRLFFFL